MSDFEIYDPRCRMYIPGNCWLEKLYTGARWLEGPVYFADGNFLLFSDIPNNRILRWVEGSGTTVYRQPSNHSNGNTRDREGHLITCEHGARRVTRTEYDGAVTVLADRYQGKRLNSPNDVVVKSDGSIWFTDPPYGILTDYEGHKAESELEANYVFRLDPESGDLTVVSEDFDRPNGLAFSPDESILYVSDTGLSDDLDGPPYMRALDVKNGKELKGNRLFVKMSEGASDGFRLDTDGNIWTSAGKGVNCYNAQGDLLLRIHVPEKVSNLTFGGPERNRLFITGHTSLYSIFTGQNGVLRP